MSHNGCHATSGRSAAKLESWEALVIGLAFVVALVGLVLIVSLLPAKAEASTADSQATDLLAATSEAPAADLQAAERMTEEQYAMTRAGIEANYQAELRALDELWAKAQGGVSGDAGSDASGNMTALDWMMRPYYQARIAMDIATAPLAFLHS